MMAGPIILFVIGSIILLLGYLIKVQRMAYLISGFDPKKVRDVSGLTNWVGGKVLLVGLSLYIYGAVVLAFRGNLPDALHLVAVAVLLGISLWTFTGAQKY